METVQRRERRQDDHASTRAPARSWCPRPSCCSRSPGRSPQAPAQAPAGQGERLRPLAPRGWPDARPLRQALRLCRDRWRHHLARDVYHRPFTARDDDELRRLVERFGGRGRWKDIGRAVYGRTSRVMKHRWKELRKMMAAAKNMTCCPPALPSVDDREPEEMADQSGEMPALQQDPSHYFADDVLASSFSSCSLSLPYHGRRGPHGRKPRVRARLHGGLSGPEATSLLLVIHLLVLICVSTCSVQ
ncbi:hypothetical protein ACP70R_033216 [Stipagrostis hirtigluma subsp. patula]